jgi:glycosyl transferase family 25
MKTVLTQIINLERSTERLEKTATTLSDLGIKWERCIAIDGWNNNNSLETLIDTQAFHKQHGKQALPGEVGCYASHLKALKHFVNSDFDFSLIMEDDIELGSDLPTIIQELIQSCDKWDLVKLSGIHNGTPLKIKNLKTKKYSISIMLTSYTGASCYMVNKHAASIMIEQLFPMSLPYDLAYDRGWLTGLKVRAVTPPPCHHSFAMGSELHPKGVVRKNFHWTKRISTHFWRLKNGFTRLTYGLTEYFIEIKFYKKFLNGIISRFFRK